VRVGGSFLAFANEDRATSRLQALFGLVMVDGSLSCLLDEIADGSNRRPGGWVSRWVYLFRGVRLLWHVLCPRVATTPPP
jgi:hypothetical protein